MRESFVDLTTPHGSMETFIVHPDEGGPHPVVVFLMDAPGMREELRDMCRRLASAGYYVAAPQLYYRKVREFNVFENGDRERMFELMHSIGNDMVDGDVGVVIEHAAGDGDADATAVGTVGYCMSGPFALTAAAAHSEVVKAAASIHGVRLAVDADDSPHHRLPQMNAELYVGCAEIDEYAPPEMVQAFEDAIAETGANGRVEWYPGAHHGFVFPERGPMYDRDSAERHWQRLHSLFRRTLHAA
ncbi:MAG: dienelactone hydrolase family protein [Actinomycetota bacterium]